MATAAKIAMPRMTIRREDGSRSEVTIPTRDRPTSRIGNSMTSPNARNSVVTKSKYEPAVISGWRSVVEKLTRNWAANGRTMQAMHDAEGEEEQGDRDPRSGRAPFARGQARRDERPALVEQDRHRQDDPDHDRDLDLDDERVAQAR